MASGMERPAVGFAHKREIVGRPGRRLSAGVLRSPVVRATNPGLHGVVEERVYAGLTRRDSGR